MSGKIIHLELGDIIKLQAPTNDDLNDKTFIISYIDDTLLELNSAEKNITLNLIDNKLTEETITKISILYKNDIKGFARQNNLIAGIWVDIFFSGDIPTIITGEITDLIEDMIELRLYPSNDVIYIDFSYQGIPRELNIDKINIRNPPSLEKPSDIVKKTQEIDVEVIDEKTFEDLLEVTPPEVPAVKIQDEIIEGSKIIFGESMGELVQEIEVEDKLKRFDLDAQVNDLLDELLSKIPKQNRTYSVINEIHTYIERFKQLRDIFSEFDSMGNLTEKVLKGVYNKPLKNTLDELKKKIPWILPVVINKKKIYHESGSNDIPYVMDLSDQQDNNHIIPIELATDINELIQISNLEVSDDDSMTLFRSILKKSKPYYKPFEQYLSDVSIINKEAKTFIEAISNMEDMESFAVSNGDLKTIKYQLTPYLNGDVLNIIGFIILPRPYIEYSKRYLPGINIHEKSIINKERLLISDILNKYTKLNTIEINNLSKHYQYKSFDKGVKHITLNTEEKDYNKFLDIIIPKIKDFIRMEGTNIQLNDTVVSYNKFLKLLEPYHIYYDDLTFSQYKDIGIIVRDEILKYRKELARKEKNYLKYRSIRNSELKKYNLYYSKIYDLMERYAIVKKNLSSEEFIKICMEKDGGAFLFSNISNMGFKYFSGIKLDKDSINEKLITLKASDDDTCPTNIISKKYNTLKELEYDNNRDIYFDVDKDPTRYDIYKELELSLEGKSLEERFEYVKQHLINAIGINEDMAIKDSNAMINGKRMIEENDLCVLEVNMEKNKLTYYRRKNNNWVLDPEIEENSFKDKTKLLCDTKLKCVSEDNNCVSIENKKVEKGKKDMGNILTKIEIERNQLLYDIKSKLIDEYDFLGYNLTYNVSNTKYNDINRTKIEIEKQYSKNETLVSPYLELLNAILGQKDFVKKQNDILRFERLYTTDGETIYVRNCKITNVKLFPVFLSILAKAFNNGTYKETLEQVCKDYGEISDSGDSWVDKYSGMVIKQVDFSTEEGYDESGYKVVSREVIDSQIKIDSLLADPSKFQGDKGIIFNVISSMCNYMGITISEHDMEQLVKNIVEIIQLKVPEKSVYEKKRNLAMTKSKKIIPTYEITYYNILLLASISYLFIHIQCNVPNMKAKKNFPGCIKSFSGYPLEDETNISGLTYISCIANKIKTDNTPWNTIRKVKQELLTKQLIVFIKSIVKLPYVIQKIDEKKEYLRKNPEKAEEPESIIVWESFLPSLNTKFTETFTPFAITFFENYNSNFKTKDYFYLFFILSKISKLTLYNQELLNKHVNSIEPSIFTNIGIPYLENSSDLTLYNQIDNWYDIKMNELANEYITYYDYTKSLSVANIRINANDTKLIYTKIPNIYSENTIYNTFIHYCIRLNNKEEDLRKICRFNGDEGYKSKQDLLDNGIRYEKEDLFILLKHIYSKNIYRNKIVPVLPLPQPTNEFLLEFNLRLLPLIEIKHDLYSKHTKVVDELRNYMLTFIQETKEKVSYLLTNDLSYSKKKIQDITSFFENLDTWDTVNGSHIINSKDLTSNTNTEFLRTLIYNIGNLYPNIVKNKPSFAKINVRKELKLSERHILSIQTFVHEEFIKLERFYDESRIVPNIDNIILTLEEVTNYISNGPSILIQQSFNESDLVFGREIITEIYVFFLFVCFNVYLDEVSRIEDLAVKKILGDLLITCIEMMDSNKKTLNMTQNEMYKKLLKYKETEKSEITTYLRDISDEMRKVENVMKINKLGKWSKGQVKGLVVYDADTYDSEMIQEDVRDAKNQDSSLSIEESEEQQEDLLAREIENSEMKIMMGEDDDYGDLDGDEAF